MRQIDCEVHEKAPPYPLSSIRGKGSKAPADPAYFLLFLLLSLRLQTRQDVNILYTASRHLKRAFALIGCLCMSFQRKNKDDLVVGHLACSHSFNQILITDKYLHRVCLNSG